MGNVLQEIASNLYDGEDKGVAGLVRNALDSDIDPQEILSAGLIAGMDKVGKDFKAGVLYVPEVLQTARAMNAGMEILRPFLVQGDSGFSVDKCIIGTVKGDLHDIGKNLVKMLLEGAGYEIVDLGTDVGSEAFVDSIRQHQPKLLGLSAMLTTTMVYMKSTIEAITASGLRDSVKIMIGGAPVTAEFAKQIGADAYASDAASAVEVARTLVASATN
ncbi:MAG: methyltransferase [Chloroflexi bacterium GWB2_49_20]|nr:MAG: methyltransferase [Chloroflexi bacterium GWB2_49_20]OGN78032.1 MAG: methyltransferase [Chloroflexi bacterium GWC2_49_37]OGN85070.1 MAG: methyltransferase [Chloroflexi bacterium GWD2_49_16]HBG74892.1 cobalamin-binding protein [Anaerolineae bacterium]HCC78383.1 cobalamin-binding protein [Anaerolineae bacterium]